MKITKINSLIKLFSNDKKLKQPKKNTKPPVIGKSSFDAKDLCEVNFLSTKNCLFFEIKLKKNVAINANKIT